MSYQRISDHDHAGHDHADHAGHDHGHHDHAGHDHDGNHDDHHDSHAVEIGTSEGSKDRTKLYLATGFCFSFMVVEFVAGFLAHSLAIMTDGAHLFTDVTAFGLAIAASFLSEKKASSTHSYGYRRFEVLSSLISTLLIW